MKNSVRIFVINLADAADRREMMTRQLAALDASAEFIRAVDGHALSAAELARHYNDARAERERELLSPAEIGCALSHLSVYRKIIAENLPGALILEDDAKLSGDTLTVTNRLAELVPPDEARVVLLNHVPLYLRRGQTPLTVKHSLALAHGLCWRAHGYFVTRAAAKRLLKKLYPVWIVADHWRRIQETGAVTVSAVVPFVIELEQAAEHSSIVVRGVKRRGVSGGMQRIYRRYCHVEFPLYVWRKIVRGLRSAWFTVSGNIVRQAVADGEESENL